MNCAHKCSGFLMYDKSMVVCFVYAKWDCCCGIVRILLIPKTWLVNKDVAGVFIG